MNFSSVLVPVFSMKHLRTASLSKDNSECLMLRPAMIKLNKVGTSVGRRLILWGNGSAEWLIYKRYHLQYAVNVAPHVPVLNDYQRGTQIGKAGYNNLSG